MRDEDETLNRKGKRPISHWGDDARAEVGSEIRRRARTPALGIAMPDLPAAEITSPIELLDRDLSESQIEIVRGSRRNSDDPATYADVVKLADSLVKARYEEKSNNTERANQLLTLLNRPPDEHIKELNKRIGELDRRTGEIERPMRIIKWIAGAVLAGTGAMILKTADFIASRSELQGEATIRMKHMEDRLQHMDDVIDRLSQSLNEKRYSPAPDRAWLQPPSKDLKP